MLAFFSEQSTATALTELAGAPQLTVFVGAGSSKELGLPTWRELVLALVEKAIATEPSWLPDAAWLTTQITTNDLLSAAERVEVILGEEALRDAIVEILYGSDAPSQMEPGPLAEGVALMKKAWADDLRIATTNYDQLLLTALRRAGVDEAKSYCLASGHPGVIHLHGVLGYEAPADGENVVVLTESDYLAPTDAGWRTDFMKRALESPCVFLGASLTDLNLLGPLYAGRSDRASSTLHRVLFVRDPVRTTEERRRRTALEDVERRRWARLNVEPLFCDNYADVAQFAYELAERRGGNATPLTQRFQTWWNDRSSGVLSLDTDSFRSNQVALADVLAEVLSGIQEELDAASETMSLGICALFPPNGGAQERPINWVTSDRAMTTPHTLDFLELDPRSNWTAVRSLCAGVHRAEPKDVYASRWRYVWAEPIFSDTPRVPVGAVMLSSMAPVDRTQLPRAESTHEPRPDRVRALRDALVKAGRIVLLTES